MGLFKDLVKSVKTTAMDKEKRDKFLKIAKVVCDTAAGIDKDLKQNKVTITGSNDEDIKRGTNL